MSSLTLTDIDNLIGDRLGVIDLACPHCGPGRHGPTNRARKVLRIWRQEPGFASYLCARCGLRGWAGGKRGNVHCLPPTAIRRIDKAPDEHAVRQAEKALALWRRREPAEGSLVETYLRVCRGYGGPIPATIGFLPASKPEHHPAMIACFGLAAEPEPGVLSMAARSISGIHLTLLRPDGSGKAGTDRDKLMVGPSAGWPIVLAPFNDQLGLIVCEGIETGLSLAEATGVVSGRRARLVGCQRLPTISPTGPTSSPSPPRVTTPDERGAQALADRLRARGLHCNLCILEESRRPPNGPRRERHRPRARSSWR